MESAYPFPRWTQDSQGHKGAHGREQYAGKSGWLGRAIEVNAIVSNGTYRLPMTGDKANAKPALDQRGYDLPVILQP